LTAKPMTAPRPLSPAALRKVMEDAKRYKVAVEIPPVGQPAIIPLPGCDSDMWHEAAYSIRLLIPDPPKPERITRSDRKYIPAAVRDLVMRRDGRLCAYCGCKDGPFHLDHIIPWARGGTHDAGNLTVACRTCNQSKGDKTPEEWRGPTQ